MTDENNLVHNVLKCTLAEVISVRASDTPDQAAISAPDRRWLTYGQLHGQVQSVVRQLNSIGIGRNDRVAIDLPNGPELAVAVLAVSATATSAPFNPGYREAEFEFFLNDIGANALIVQGGVDSPARIVAQARGTPVIELMPDTNREAGLFTLIPASSQDGRRAELAGPDDAALILHTSGTTSRPKRVPLTHSNLLASAANIAACLELTKEDVCFNVMPLFHIHGLVGAFFSSLVAGARIVFSPEFNAPRFLDALIECQATWYTAVPTMHQAILEHVKKRHEGDALSSLRFIRSSSAPLPANITTELEAFFQVPVIEAYGMTEASHQIATNRLPPGRRKPGSVGLPFGTEVAVMDDAGEIVPANGTGEILIRGANVTRGYENNSAANGHAFVDGWFRTGDLGILDEDGYLFISGRLKEIINRGGEKVSPSEVDQVILEHPAVAQVVTYGMPHGKLGEEVAAAVVLRQNTSVTEREIQEFAAQRLAEYKVPRRVVIVDEIPKTATGKLQRIGLAKKLGIAHSDRSDADAASAFVPPRSHVEEALANIWSQVLRAHPIGAQDNFFDLGGDSVLASQVISRVGASFKVELSFLTFFDAPTLASMAESIASVQRKDPARTAASISPVAWAGETPLSFAQQRLWFFDQLEPGSPTYNRPTLLHLQGRLDTAALEKSLNEIIHRHESVRTTFPSVDGRPRQVVSQAARLTLPTVDLRQEPQTVREAEARRLATQEGKRPFDLTSDLLLRATLVKLGDEEHILVVTTHHIAFDGWSDEIFFRELAVLYHAFSAGRVSPLPPLPVQYGDIAVWQRQLVQGGAFEAHLAYWKQRLAGAPPALDLPTDRPRPPIQTFQGARHSMSLSETLSNALKTLGRRKNVTLYMTLLAAFQVLIHRYTAQHDVVVGTPIAGRNKMETENLIGVFINTLVLRTDLSGDPPFRELLGRVRKVCLAAYAHADLPFERLVEEMQPERDMSRNPLFQAMFQLRNTPKGAVEWTGVKVEELEFDIGLAKLDLTLEIVDRAEGLACWFDYNTDLFDGATIARMSAHFQRLLQSIVADPGQRISQLSMLTDAELHQLVVEWNATKSDYPNDTCIHELFEEQVERTPEAVAVVFENMRLSYRELNRRANQLAHYLRKLGVGREVLVGICIQRSVEMIVGVLAILKAGGAYVPLDPSYPEDRLEFMLEDSQAWVLLTQESLVSSLPETRAQRVFLDKEGRGISQESEENLSSGVRASNLAYVIYTSGSTGQPKGVAIEHRSATALLCWARKEFTSEDLAGVLAATSICFDLSVFELFVPLSWGGRVIIAENALGLPHLSAAREITLVNTVPSAIAALLRQDEVPGSVRTVNLAGEPLASTLVEKLYRRSGIERVYDLYGPTEYTTYSTFALREAQGLATIGRPIANTQIHILDSHLNPVPIGVRGELHIGGEGLARGYLNWADLTGDKFIPNPVGSEPGERLYRTGDFARYLPDGNIEFLGRIDNQVKIRGFRIETGEIEVVLGQHPNVRETVIVAKQDQPGDKRLVAYVVAQQGQLPTSDEMRSFLEQKLPDYMIPSAFVMLDSMPLTPNGKIDRRALPASDHGRAELREDFVAPRTPVQEVLAKIWAKILGVERVGVHDNFFDLGGHSLLMIQLQAEIRDATGRSVSTVELFKNPTVRSLAEFLQPTRAKLTSLDRIQDRVSKQRSALARQSRTGKEPKDRG